MTLQFLILIGGLVLILLGANSLVDGSSSIARKYGLSEFVIGLTIVGIGTSTPEMVVSILSSIQGKADMAIGNVVGSNIFNTMLILGMTAIVSPLRISKNAKQKDIPLNIAVTVLLIILGMNATIFGCGKDQLSRLDGAFLLSLFVWYIYKSFKSDQSEDIDDEHQEVKEQTVLSSAAYIVAGMAGLIIGGKLFVNSAISLAQMFGVSDKFIAITIMAGGTSLPELATSVVAAFKGKGQMALGNILGSNISNILLILGSSALIAPLSFSGMTYVDLGTLLLSAVFILSCAYLFKKDKIDRTEGVILLLMEVAYIWWLFANL